MIILDGKKVSLEQKKSIKEQVIKLKDIYNKTPKLAIVLVGENPASAVYVRNKIKACEFTGIESELIKVDETITQEELLEIVEKLNNDVDIHGIIVQLPLPRHINEQVIIDSINNKKDVDGFGIENKGKLFCGLNSLHSATPEGIMHLLDAYNIPIEGRHAVVIGRSNIVGKPVAMLLLSKNATVTMTHSRTKDLPSITRQADILVVAIGKAKFVTSDMVKEGAVVIDVGINRVDGALCGDVDFENVKEKTSYITPVPGGVGPLTIASLLQNTLIAFENIMNENK